MRVGYLAVRLLEHNGLPSGILSEQNVTTSSQYFHYFPAGQHTLEVEDPWRESVLAYFTVT